MTTTIALGSSANALNVAQTGTQYVTTTGNDANDGLTWASAKLTIQAAINALPVAANSGADGVTPNGVVEVGSGVFAGSSSQRIDAGCGIQSGVFTITDPSITSNDVGSYVGPAATGCIGSKILAVNPGVSFTVSIAPTVNNASISIPIIKPLSVLYPGVRVRGRGSINGLSNVSGSRNYPTVIQDNGSGYAIAAPMGQNAIAGSVETWAIEDLVVSGNTGNIAGIYAVNTNDWAIRNVTAISNGQWGIYLDQNAMVQGHISDSMIMYNGTSGASVQTGGLYISPLPNIGVVENTQMTENFGFGCLGAWGTHFIACGFQYTQTTALAGSGVGLWTTSGTGGGGPITLDQCWLEGNNASSTSGQCLAQYPMTLRGTMFQGISNCFYGLYVSLPAASGGFSIPAVDVHGCVFQGHTHDSIRFIGGANGGVLSWRACVCADPNFILGPGGSGTVPATAAAANGIFTGNAAGAFYTNPAAATSVALTSGTAWQNTTGGDALLAVQLTVGGSGGTAALARGPHGSAVAIGTVTRAAAESGDTEVLEYYVPANWDFEVTLSGMTFTANAVAQPV